MGGRFSPGRLNWRGRKREFRIRLLITIVALAVFGAHSSGIAPLRAVSQLENLSYDTRLRLSMPMNVDERIVIVGVDEPSLAREGRWPWPRERMAALVDILFDDYRVRAMGLDLVFAEPQDRPAALVDGDAREPTSWRSIRGWPDPSLAPAREWTADERLAEALRGRPVSTAIRFRQEDDGPSVGQLPEPVMRWESLPQGVEPRASESFTGNLPVLAEVAASGFSENVMLDADGHYRRTPLFRAHRGQIYPSLALQMAWLIQGRPGQEAMFSDQAGGWLLPQQGLRLGEAVIPMDRETGIQVPFRGPRFSFPYVSAAEILNGEAPPDLLDGRIVLVGAWASRLAHNHATPVASSMPSVEVHANILSGLLDGHALRAPFQPVLAELLTLALLAALMMLVFMRFAGWLALSASLFILISFSLANLALWQGFSLVLPYASAALLILSLFVAHLIYTQVIEARSRSELSEVFGQYVPRELVEELSDRPQSVSLAGESRHMTVMFSDIHGFSGIAEALDPRQLTHLMNEFLTAMTRVIHHHRGTIDKYMGDSVMAFWGAPLEAPDHARRAVQAALDMQQEMARLNERFAERGWPRLRLGIGINTGHMSVGNMGSEFRMAYTVMGDAVNLASRLEGMTRQYGVGVIASEFTSRVVPDFRFMELGRTHVRGREGPVSLYEPVGARETLSREEEERIGQFERALEALQADRAWEVESLVENLLVKDPGRYGLYRRLLDALDERRDGRDGRHGESGRLSGL